MQAVEATDDTFWDQFWSESSATISDVFTLIPASEIRALRDENPSNLATLCYKVSVCLDTPQTLRVMSEFQVVQEIDMASIRLDFLAF